MPSRPTKTTPKTTYTSLQNSTLTQRHNANPPPHRANTTPLFNKDRKEEMEFKDLSRKSQWIALAVMSGACAAFNGVFAKLTTTDLTTTFATHISALFGLKTNSTIIEALVRGTFFTLNLLFNFIMWALFTKALARGTSTTQVSILNTSTNFLITAILGYVIFAESLPPLWFLGAGFLVAGNVIIGRREEKDGSEGEGREGRRSGDGLEGDGLLGEDVELVDDGGDEVERERGEGRGERERERERERREREVDDDVLDLGDEGRGSEDLMDLRR
ncbi:Multidrug resistance efflux transporter EmrE [Glarea lozoyensis ATCC 20868]|uniref:Multidrug resistance efflux transporter EmrE n=1 Tax=Glarea lozoyensis (strain ATCC 20868 / MF5171) TaxID=1116229 RepID=S3D1Q1_GLAL2|nr:Multidrug resistance efflux transporter EmrE [Glarea lozoyensis ATCC 20868]EPE25966.1 Multidrug resistance efflux transporter EmrE [Glarea lozoyensis ATCC 20868]